MKNRPVFYIGCSGFYNQHWRKIFYPENLPQKNWLDFYCEQFNTLELNTTFYKFPTKQSLAKWNKKSPDNFLFSVKAPRIITHFKKFNDCERLLSDFYLACDEGLGNKLGCTLFQLPQSIHFSQSMLLQIIENLNLNFKNVIEFRHKSWWKKSVYNELTKNNIIFCTVSHPGLPATVVETSSTGYVRLHGNKKMFYSSYSKKELDQLHQTILKKRKLKTVYIYFNNTASIAGVVNARQLQEMTSELIT